MKAQHELETYRRGCSVPGPEGEGGRNIRGGNRYQRETVQSEEEASLRREGRLGVSPASP